MKKIVPIIIIIFFIIGIIYTINNDNFIKDSDNLYDVAVKYIENEQMNNGNDKYKDNYHIFTDYETFGIIKKNNKKYVYMWILTESYYVENNEIKSSEGSSMPYKFTFEDDKIIKYEIPKDGTEYEPSIRKLFPNSIENKVINYSMDNKLKNSVDEYYSKFIN